MKLIELLAPAQNLEFGMAAINYGADAVYIGSPKFGARAAAGNSFEDIKNLASYAHKYYAKVYVTINTILYDYELDEVQNTIKELYTIGVDAIIIQDMAILEMDIPPIPLYASTQTHNFSWEKVKFFEDVGIQRVILARELSLKQIKLIRTKTNIELESFIHGALCVSLSGQCYFSHSIAKGSANRGACAQPCRAYYSLLDRDGNILVKDKHLLSLKDLNFSNSIKELLQAGISSFKIEGRLKNIDYVKNVTSYYRKLIDQNIANNNDLQKSSSGDIIYDFETDLEKTFNRGYTDYFLTKRNKEIGSTNTQKATGKLLGKVKSVHKNYFTLDSNETVHNSDGICFFDKNKKLQGTKINKVDKNKLFPGSISNIHVGVEIFRNFDFKFNKDLSSSKTERKISTFITINEIENGISIHASDEDNNKILYEYNKKKELANNPKKALENIKTQLSKSGDSIFKILDVSIKLDKALFFPISELNEIRRKTLDKLESERLRNYKNTKTPIVKNNLQFPEKAVDYKGNVSNKLAKLFYKRHGVNVVEDAFEIQSDISNKEIMITKHCIKYQIGACEKYEKNPKNILEPMFIKDNNRKYKLEFDCKNCMMKIISP